MLKYFLGVASMWVKEIQLSLTLTIAYVGEKSSTWNALLHSGVAFISDCCAQQ